MCVCFLVDEIIDEMISYLFDFVGERAFHNEKDCKLRDEIELVDSLLSLNLPSYVIDNISLPIYHHLFF